MDVPTIVTLGRLMFVCYNCAYLIKFYILSFVGLLGRASAGRVLHYLIDFLFQGLISAL